MAFTPVAALAELWSGELTARTVGGRQVLLVRIADAVHAYEDRCAHLGVPLSTGQLEGDVLTCSAHQWQYDIRSGFGLNPRTCRLTPFPVRVEHGQVLVDVDRHVRPRGECRPG
jgi:toluene monooxygenase system ferredoxin subunit